MCRYCDSSYSFPSQQDVINFTVRTSLEFLQVHPDALIVVGSYTIGKERLFRGMILVVHVLIYFRLYFEHTSKCFIIIF